MTVGNHTVTVYPDRTAGDWSDPIASNPYLTVDLAGWRESPYSPAWTWQNGAAIGGTALSRSDTAGVLVPAGVTQFRARFRFTIDRFDTVYWGISFGVDAYSAWAGPYWAPDDAVQIWGGSDMQAGTYLVEQTWTPTDEGWPADFADYPYCGPRISWSADTVGSLDSIELSYIGADGVDFSCLVDSVSINHGRQDSDSQPDAPSATLELSTDPAGLFSLPPEVEIGAIVKVATTTVTATSLRFVGRVTDINLGWADAGTETPDAGVGQLICTGVLDDTARKIVGDTPWPVELDGTRITRIMALAGVTLDPEFSDPGVVNIVARDVDAQPALDLAREVAASANGIIWQTRNGEIRYADSEHRRGTTSSLDLDACDVLVTPTWKRSLAGLVNSASIGYGVAEDGGEQPRYTTENPTSIAAYGTYGYSVATQLAELGDAQAMGALLMARNSSPVWIMSDLPVSTEDLTDDQYQNLLSLDVGSLLSLTGLPAIGTAPTTATLWVEGWSEVLTAGGHELTLVVSGYCRTAPSPRWDDLPAATTWDDVDPLLTWDDVTCFGPPTIADRWADVPAGLRWDQVPTTTTWDTWTVPSSTPVLAS